MAFNAAISRLKFVRARRAKEIQDKARADAEAAGLDPRSIDALIARQAKRESERASTGSVMLTEGDIQQRKAFRKTIKAETSSADSLQRMREERQKQVQARARRLISGGGKVSLLSGPSGGSGFLSGYFK